MKTKMFITIILIPVFIIALLACGPAMAAMPGSSPGNAVPFGATMKTFIGCRVAGTTTDNLYNVKITLREIVRGTKTTDLLKKVNKTYEPPKP